MTMPGCLLLYGVVVAIAAPAVLVRAGHGGLAPRMGVVAWLVAMGSVLGSWLLVVGQVVTGLAGRWSGPGGAVGSCLALVGRVLAWPHRLLALIVLAVLSGVAVLAAGRLVVRLAAMLRRARWQAARHREAARIVGRRVPGLDAIVVVDTDERAAYCVAGRPPTIVVTSAVLDVLDRDQLGAVLAHERAHLTGRHHLILAVTQGLARLLPGVRLFTLGAAEIGRLVEMSADDTAARKHGRAALVGALVALATRPAAPAVPAIALGVTGSAVDARADRLLRPAGPAHRWLARLVLTLVLAVLLVGPLVATASPAVTIAWCRLPLG